VSASSIDPDHLQGYWRRELNWGWGYQSRRVFESLVEEARRARFGVVLDAGAGHKRYQPFFDEHSLYLTQEHPAGIEFKRMQGIVYDLVSPIDERIPLRTGTLDLVVNTSVVEHVRHPEQFFQEAHRVLRPGGRMLIHGPFVYPEHEVPYDFQRPTRYGLEAWLGAAGFVDILVEPATCNTEAALSFLRSSVERDLAGDRLAALKKSPSRAALRWATSRPFNLLHAALTWVVVVVMASMLRLATRRILERGPNSATSFPVGWIATATKPGKSPARQEKPAREEFLAGNADA
jgi:SAM-dependent methyltransferase